MDEMIGDFFTKLLEGAKFRRFRNIIMNCGEDEHGTVNVDELMASYYRTVDVRISDKNPETTENEPTFLKNENLKAVNSQECVGDIGQSAHKIDVNGGQANVCEVTHRRKPRTWAQVVAVAE